MQHFANCLMNQALDTVSAYQHVKCWHLFVIIGALHNGLGPWKLACCTAARAGGGGGSPPAKGAPGVPSGGGGPHSQNFLPARFLVYGQARLHVER